jgi:YgiT-type zinc finger domain-containing protein
MTKPFDQCPTCGGELVTKEVEKLLRGGNHTAVVRVSADVCLHCGERLYSTDTVKRFEEIRTKLIQEQTTDFQPMGHAFHVTG